MPRAREWPVVRRLRVRAVHWPRRRRPHTWWPARGLAWPSEDQPVLPPIPIACGMNGSRSTRPAASTPPRETGVSSFFHSSYSHTMLQGSPPSQPYMIDAHRPTAAPACGAIPCDSRAGSDGQAIFTGTGAAVTAGVGTQQNTGETRRAQKRSALAEHRGRLSAPFVPLRCYALRNRKSTGIVLHVRGVPATGRKLNFLELCLAGQCPLLGQLVVAGAHLLLLHGVAAELVALDFQQFRGL